ncbi:MAG TPA: hypothetical protein CFH78_07285 [Sulfurimonas sp. UBA10385]|nr:MAG TPA: hypothetical protein CFH78_07285 [Sulfurimonas sp. UBA10385]
MFEKGWWGLGKFYIFNSLTFKGRSFLENNDKKEYPKIEKTEVIYHNNISVGGNNHGSIITGNNNTVISEFDTKFNNLLQAINSSNVQDKELIIQELNNNKSNEVSLKKYLGTVLTKGAEFGSIVSAVSALLSL